MTHASNSSPSATAPTKWWNGDEQTRSRDLRGLTVAAGGKSLVRSDLFGRRAAVKGYQKRPHFPLHDSRSNLWGGGMRALLYEQELLDEFSTGGPLRGGVGRAEALRRHGVPTAADPLAWCVNRPPGWFHRAFSALARCRMSLAVPSRVRSGTANPLGPLWGSNVYGSRSILKSLFLALTNREFSFGENLGENRGRFWQPLGTIYVAAKLPQAAPYRGIGQPVTKHPF